MTSNKKSKPLVTPEENIIRLGDTLYAIPGQFKKAEVIDIGGGQVVIDTSPLITISGDNIEELFYSTDEYITFLNQNAVLVITDQTVTGTKTWLDSQVFGTNLVPQGATQSVGTLAQPFNEGHYTSLYADEIISSGSPGLRLTHGGGAGIIDTTENNDLNFRRFGNSFLKFLASGISLEQDVVMLGNLNVQGTTTSINTEQLLVEDNVITLNHNYTGMPMLDSGLVINRGTETDSVLLWDEGLDTFVAGISGSQEPFVFQSGLIATSGVLQADINTRATFAQLLSASGVLQSDINDRVLRSGDTMTGFLTLHADPTNSSHATNRNYVDTGLATKLNLSGGTLTGDVIAGSTSVDLGSASNRFGIVQAATFNRPDGDVTLSASDDVVISANGANGDIFLRTAGGADRWAVAAGGAFYPTITNGVLNVGTSSRHANFVYARRIYSDGSGQDLTLMAQDDIFISPAETTQWTFNNSGTFFPTGNGSRAIGGSSNHLANLYTRRVNRTDGDLTVSVDSTNSKVQLGVGTSSNYANGAFLELHGNASGGAGDVRLGAGSGNIHLYAGSLGGSNAIRWTINQVGTLTQLNNDDNGQKLVFGSSNGSFSNVAQRIVIARGPTNGFEFFRTEAATDTQHLLHGNGDILIDGSLFQGLPDYAEYFEIKDGEAAIEVGESVVLDGDRIRKYDEDVDAVTDILGVIRPKGQASAINHPLNWPHKYERDDFGRYILDENGDRIVSAEYDESQEYILRSERSEWYLVGLLGQVQVLKSSAKSSSWRKMKDISATVELWFIR